MNYPKYKAISLLWLDSIPQHWDFKPNKYLMQERKESVAGKSDQYQLLSLSLNGVILRDMINIKGKFPKDFETYQVTKKDDLIFCLFDIPETPRTIGISPYNGMITGAYNILEIINSNSKYFYYYYLYIDNSKLLEPLYTGLRKVININTFLSLKSPLPPKEEQDQIVRYLDYKLAEIKCFIVLRKKQIALLKEQKQAIINHAVTKGITPSVEMKDSGIKWIGSIPSHWEVKRLKYVATINTGATPSSFVSKFWENGDIIWYTPKDIGGKNKNISNSKTKISALGFENSNTTLVSSYSIILTTRAPIGNLAISTVPATFNQGCKSITITSDTNIEFMYYILSILTDTLNSLGNGSTFKELSNYALASIYLSSPPLEEQDQIVAYIEEKTQKIDKEIDILIKEISLTEEYKMSLISEVVTGKKDVRKISVPNIPNLWTSTENNIIEDIEEDEEDEENVEDTEINENEE